VSPFFSDLVEQAQAFSQLEIIAVLLAVAYLLLAIRQSIWCWYCAGASTAIYIGLFIDAKLYMESVLNGFYFVMAIYGWFVWRAGRDSHDALPVTRWPLRIHGMAIGLVILLSTINGYLLSRYTDAAFPYLDSLTTWSAIWATFLVARKVLENWWYWLVIDIASVFIYLARDLPLTSMLFVVYVIMIPFGLLSWSRSMREQPA
jgi:nicotinamide mononucleotide transporter